jgi:polyhydroxyalkanoate synthesis repressor PhaR
MTDLEPAPDAEQPFHASSGGPRVIKRYSNRKLYDTSDSRYVTLLQIAEMVRAGEEVQIIDNATKEDKTDITLALIISEELKSKPRGIPLSTLKALIRSRGGKILSQLREGPLGKLMPREGEAEAEGETAGEDEDITQRGDADVNKDSAPKDAQPGAIRRTIEQWQHAIDERIRTILPDFSVIRELQAEVKRLSDRVAELENRRPPDNTQKPE